MDIQKNEALEKAASPLGIGRAGGYHPERVPCRYPVGRAVSRLSGAGAKRKTAASQRVAHRKAGSSFNSKTYRPHQTHGGVRPLL